MENATQEIKNPSDSEQSEVEKLQEELSREKNMHLRTLADFDNYRKRIERERASMAQAGKRDLILSLLGVVDNFERALEHAPKRSDKFYEGLKAIYKQLQAVLE